MFHSETRALIELWRALADRNPGGLPPRAALRPERLGGALTRAFLAERRLEDARLRLAGDGVEAFHDEALTGAVWTTLWAEESRVVAASSLLQCVREGRPVVLAASACQSPSQFEVALAAFRGRPGEPELILGVYAGLPRASERRPNRLTALGCAAVGEPRRPRLALAALDGRRIA